MRRTTPIRLRTFSRNNSRSWPWLASSSSKNHSNFCHSVELEGGDPLKGRNMPSTIRMLNTKTEMRVNLTEWQIFWPRLGSTSSSSSPESRPW